MPLQPSPAAICFPGIMQARNAWAVRLAFYPSSLLCARVRGLGLPGDRGGPEHIAGMVKVCPRARAVETKGPLATPKL